MAAGVAPSSIGQGPDAVKSISASVVYSAMREIRRRLETAIDSMKVKELWARLRNTLAYMYMLEAADTDINDTEWMTTCCIYRRVMCFPNIKHRTSNSYIDQVLWLIFFS